MVITLAPSNNYPQAIWNKAIDIVIALLWIGILDPAINFSQRLITLVIDLLLS